MCKGWGKRINNSIIYDALPLSLSLSLYIYKDTQDEVICNENINYAKTQNQIREIRNTQRYLIKKFKEKEHQTLYYIN